MQPACLGQRRTLVNTQRPIRLRHACYVIDKGRRGRTHHHPTPLVWLRRWKHVFRVFLRFL